MSSGMVPLELSKDNNQYCKISVFMPNAGSINESVISVTNVGGDSFSVAVSMIRWNANKVFCKLINGTKISNINMYYTVDTERFCFYIKANWYAKIIVSRLGLVNTSKIESINAIPSGAIEVPISWRDKRYSTDLGELLGNPKGTKSFSSWSEFTDFVNEMPIKTIQPFVSNFNAFAGEGFYGNVVQGLVIIQLEDAVFIFGIAIDGTLIFRKRNYPDVSTWEDPKIIIHSNNWHKIYFVTDLGELLPLSTNTNKGLTRRTAYFDLIQGKLYKIAYKEELYVYKPVICLLYVLRNGISSCYVASLSGYRNGVSHFKLICGNDIQFKLYQKLNSANYFDIMLECPDNSAGIMEIKAMDDLTVIETTEPLRDWQQIATE